MRLCHIEDRVAREDALEVLDDVGHGRVRAAEVEAPDPIEGVPPRRCHEHDEEGVPCLGVLGEARAKVALGQRDGQVEERQVSAGQLEDRRVELEAHPLRVREMAKEPIERVAGPGERIDDGDAGSRRDPLDQACDVLADQSASRSRTASSVVRANERTPRPYHSSGRRP
jgi:hypothetical protein